jgi:outer membrane immunogenic protein
MPRFLLALLATTGLVFAAGSAAAADHKLLTKAPPPAPTAPVYSWTGLYFGGSAGFLTDSLDGSFVFPPPATWHIDHQSVIVDAHVGAQYQFANIVLGVEGNFIDTFRNGGSTDTCHPPASCAAGSTETARLVDDMWTFGGRAGLAAGASLLYVTGGYAGGAKFINDVHSANGALFESTKTTHNGSYIGGGVDWMISHNLVGGVEYRHYEFGSQTAVPVLAGSGLPNAFDTWTVKTKADTLSARLSWLFNWGGGPVMSKY